MRRLSLIATAVAALVPLWISPAQAAFPGANGLLAVQPRTGGGIVLVGADGRRAGRICTDRSQCGVPQRPRWSPDGRAIVFAGPAIKIVYPDGSCMNCQFGAAQNPAFEPGGTLISFIRRGQTTIDAIDGNRQDFQVPARASDAVWSAGGKLALVHNGAVWAGRRASPDRLARGSEPSWSPRGDAVAASQRGWVVVMRLRDHRVRRVARGSAPAFSPDGRLIAYVAPHDWVMVVSASGRSAPRRVGNVRALSVDWQPRPRGPNPGCVAPPRSKVIAGSREAVVTVDGTPAGSEFSAPSVAYMGCLRADGRERLLERFSEGNYGETSVDSVTFAPPYAGLLLTSANTHYGDSTSTLQVLDLRRGVLTKLGGQSGMCFYFSVCSTLSDVVLGRDGVSAARLQTVHAVGSLANPIRQVSCPPGAAVCVAVDGGGRLFSTTDPTAGAGGWMSGTLSGRPAVISCPSLSLCVATGGSVSTTTNPGGGPQTWTTAPSPVGDLFSEGIACPSTTLCVATHVTGIVLTSTNPTGGTSAWSTAQIDSGAVLGAVFCSTLPECFITDGMSRVLTSSNPTGGAGAWTSSTRTPAFVSGTCPTTKLCVSVEATHISTSTDPVGETWTQASVPEVMNAIACPSPSLCLAVGLNGALEISTDPAAGAWTRTTIDQGRGLDSIACSSASLCVVGDGAGHVVTSTDPTAGAAAWTPAFIAGDPCTDTTTCSEESVVVSDAAGIHTIDTSKLPGNGPFLTNLTLTGDVLSWNHAGTPSSATLARPR